MGKISAAKKKERRKDFQKVKFKVGKKLPKNLNETRATFKAKTLVLKQQFIIDKEGPVSHRNLSWKELLAHLSHHNQAIKLDAIHSLKEMITSNNDLIRMDLNNFLENIFPLFSDRDYKVREACMQLFKTFILLPNIIQKKNTLEPFYSLLSVHLSCAMTHISENVQYDSLKLLDILIENMPDLIKINAYTIFENFINQISKATLRGDKRILKNDPYKMTSTQTWRSKVLSRLFKMLLIVSSVSDIKKKSLLSELEFNNFNYETTNAWEILPSRAKSILLEIDHNQLCSALSFNNDTERQSLKICKRLNAKKNLTELNEFLEHYFNVISPLLIDCWVEAKPENKSIIETNESLSIMNSVLSIFNLLFENLKFDFKEIGKKILKGIHAKNDLKYVEKLFLVDFPYYLAENFEYQSELKNNNNQVGANTINLLICKLCSSSILKLEEENLLEIFQYSLNSLIIKKNDKGQQKLELNELITVLNLSQTILENFTNTEITKPFIVGLTKYFDTIPKYSYNKWLVFEFVCKQFYDNDNLKGFENIFESFFRKAISFCILYGKEKKEKLEIVIDWIRKLIIKKGNSQNIILSVLEDQYVDILNAFDFESKDVAESCKKKILELIYWVPKINRFLFTKLSILILKKNLSIWNSSQIMGILKMRFDMNDASFDQSDYLMFIITLFNGSSAFDLMNPEHSDEFYTLDCIKFERHKRLCQYLEEFIKSHNESDVIIDILISMTAPMLNNLPLVNCRILYGLSCLMLQLEGITFVLENYESLIIQFLNAQFWLINKIHCNQNNQIVTQENKEKENQCLNELLNKMYEIYLKNINFLNDSIPYLLKMLQNSNDLENIRKIFVVINYLLMKFGPTMKPSDEYLYSIYKSYKAFNDSNYLWWHEYCNLLKTI